MYRRILVSIDFSQPSVEALRWVLRRFPEADIVLFHSVERLHPPTYLVEAFGDRLDLAREEEFDARANLEQLAEDCGREVRLLIGRGWPPREVNRAAEEVDADLIVLGAHTRRVLPWDEPGATIGKTVDQASRRVLVWRPTGSRPPDAERTVLAALDLREGSESLGVEAGRLAEHFRARLVLLHVVSRTLQAYLRAVSSPTKVEETLKGVETMARKRARALLPAPLRKRLDVQTVVLRGRAVTQILATAESEAADLIVMGQRHAPTRTGRALLGSVTESVLRGANCSVLAVPL